MIRRYRPITIGLFILLLFSCRYSKPLIVHQAEANIEYYRDSTVKHIRKVYLFRCLREHGSCKYFITKDYYKNGNLEKTQRIKVFPHTKMPADPDIRDAYYSKEVFYSKDGKMIRWKYISNREKTGKTIKEFKVDSLGKKVKIEY